MNFFSIFHINGLKVVPANIYELLTPVALAHLIMGDGSARDYGLTFVQIVLVYPM